jgi:D-galactose 1-dehydrogenase
MRHRIGVIGLGKIAQDQHLPVIAASEAFDLVAVSSQRGLTAAGAHAYTDPAALLADAAVEAVAVCTPPQARHAIARAALEAGKHVMLEKPPTASISELADLAAVAARRGLTLMTTWHSQYNAAVDEARTRLVGETVAELFVNWKEDVRKWHPGQAWIWQAGGFGVFDPGSNALSIVTDIMPAPIFVTHARLEVPSNRQTPIGAEMTFSTPDPVPGADLSAIFDWRQQGPQSWNITVETTEGQRLELTEGGAKLAVDGTPTVAAKSEEYERIYDLFAELLTERKSHVDFRPLRILADAYLVGDRVAVEPFED